MMEDSSDIPKTSLLSLFESVNPPDRTSVHSTSSSPYSLPNQLFLGLDSNHSWVVHPVVLKMRCPYLLSEGIQEQLRNLTVHKSSFRTFLIYLYDDTLPSCDPTMQNIDDLILWADLHRISSLLNMDLLREYSANIVSLLLDHSQTSDFLTESLSYIDALEQPSSSNLISTCIDAIVRMRHLFLDGFEAIPADFKILYELLFKLNQASFFQPAIGSSSKHWKHSKRTYSNSSSTHPVIGTCCSACSAVAQPFGQLQESLESLFHTECNEPPTISLTASGSIVHMNTDFVLRVADSAIQCHKAILMARWPAITEFVNLSLPEYRFPDESGMTVSALRGLLEYIYTSKTSQLSGADCHSLLLNGSLLRLSKETPPLDSNMIDLWKYCMKQCGELPRVSCKKL